MDIKKSELFIAIQRIPILSLEDTVSDAIDAMKRKNTRLAVIVQNGQRWDLWSDEISEYCTTKGPVTPWMVNLKTLTEGVPPASEVDAAAGSVEAERLLMEERAVMVMEGGDLVGVTSKDSQALWPPAVSECVQGHLFFPPIPKKCPYDRTMVE